MTYPTAPERDYSYSGFAAGQGDNSFPGAELDADLDTTNTQVEAIVEFLKTALAADGTLKPGSVTQAALSSGVLTGLNQPTPWATATAYVANESTVTYDNSLYACLVSHDSGTFATDLAAEKWVLLATFAPLTTVSDGAITTAKIADANVTAAKLADGAVTAAKVPDASLLPAKAAVSFGVVPVGAIMPYAGLSAPSGWLLCYGQAVSRTTYADLLAALISSITATRTVGSATLTATSVNLTGLGVEGAAIEGTGIAPGTTIVSVTSTTIVMSQTATSSGTAVVTRIFPYGNGDGSTTFNMPDLRGRVPAGRDNMGGSAASRLTSATILGTKLGVAGGAETHTLTEAQLAAHDHTVTDGGHSHGVTDGGHTHNTPLSYTTVGAGASGRQYYGRTGTLDITDGPENVASSSATTGVTVNLATTGLTVNDAGSGDAHNNVQPTLVVNNIIFAGV